MSLNLARTDRVVSQPFNYDTKTQSSNIVK